MEKNSSIGLSSVSCSPSGTPASVTVSPALTYDQAFVQTLYNNFLGRTGTLTEVNGWLPMLTGTGPNTGQAAVVNGIVESTASLTRVIDGIQEIGDAVHRTFFDFRATFDTEPAAAQSQGQAGA